MRSFFVIYLRKAELSTFLQNNLQPSTSTPRPDTRTRPPRPTRPPPPPPQSVRFRPDRPRQPELLRQLEERPIKSTTFEPYQLKPKRGKETFIEPPVEQPPVEQSPSNQKQIKHMKKKLSKLNKKIKHSKKKHNNLVSKRNSIKKKIEELKGPHEPNPGHHTGGMREAQTTINLIENQTHVRTYRMTSSLNHNVSNLILDTIRLVIHMQTRVIYSFSCLIHRGRNQIVAYHRTLPTNDTCTSLSQIEEYIHQCELRHLNLNDEGVWSKAYLPAMRITNNPGVYEGRVEFHHIQVRLISSNEPLLGCGPLPDWLHGKRCIYSIDNTDDNLCVWRCLVIFKRIRRKR